MVLPNLVFDALLFGALILAALLDVFVPGLGGAASLIAVGSALYLASQEWSDLLQRRRMWSQESLATSLAPTLAGFVFFWGGRNESDFALLILSIGLMMTALMLAIAVIAALSSAWRERSFAPLLGLLLTVAGSSVLGLAGGVLTLDSRLLVLVAALGLVAWKAREIIARPQTVAPVTVDASHEARAAFERPVRQLQTAVETGVSFAAGRGAPPINIQAPPPVPRLLIPQRGTLLDRFLPVLLLGLLAFTIWRTTRLPGPLAIQTPAVADNGSSR